MNTKQQRRTELWSLLGDLPELRRPLHAELVSREEREHYFLEKLVLDLNGEEPVPAYFTRPRTGSAPFPVVLYHHAHGSKISHRQGRIHRFAQRHAAAALRARICAARLGGAVHRHLGVWRAQHAARKQHLQADAVARASDVGHDDLRQHQKPRLSAIAR